MDMLTALVLRNIHLPSTGLMAVLITQLSTAKACYTEKIPLRDYVAVSEERNGLGSAHSLTL